MELSDILDEYEDYLVVRKLLWTYNNMEDLTKKERKEIRNVVMIYMLPDQIKKEFGNKAYKKFYGKK